MGNFRVQRKYEYDVSSCNLRRLINNETANFKIHKTSNILNENNFTILPNISQQENFSNILPLNNFCNTTLASSNDNVNDDEPVKLPLTDEPLNISSSNNNNSNLKIDQLLKELPQWAIEVNITLKSLSSLLKILKRHKCFKKLPNDARSILQTPRVSNIQVMGHGTYYHFGLKKGLMHFLKNNFNLIGTVNTLKISFNIDGLPLSKSSSSQFWPILGNIHYSKYIFLIGLYHSNKGKPSDVNSFLLEFIKDVQYLTEQRINYENHCIQFELGLFIADAPAKSFILSTKGHTGYSSCTKCITEGEYINNGMCFPDINAYLRTDESFKLHTDDAFHLGNSPLENIEGFAIISQTPLDYMHLVCLGVVKKLIVLWTSGPLEVRLSFKKVQKISYILENKIKPYVPK